MLLSGIESIPTVDALPFGVLFSDLIEPIILMYSVAESRRGVSTALTLFQ